MDNKTYAGIPEEFSKQEQAKIVLIPVPYGNANTSQKGPEAFLKASESITLYDIETDTEVYQQGIYLADAVTESSAETMVNAVHQSAKKYIKKNKFVTLIGGNHAISIGAIRAFNECFNSLTVLHVDAHANLLKTYKGSSLHPDCALYEASQTTNLIQVGVRSMNAIEKTVMEDEDKIYFAHDMAVDDTWMDSAIDQMTDNVYITFDLSAIDISIMTSVAKPEPGGLFWYETLEFLRKLFEEKNIVGFDLVGLCPNELNAASDFLTARLYYKMLSYKFAEENVDDDYDNSYEGLNQKNNVSKFDDDDEY